MIRAKCGLGHFAEPDSRASVYRLNCAGVWQCFSDNDLRGRKTLCCHVWQLDSVIEKSMDRVPKWQKIQAGRVAPSDMSGAWNEGEDDHACERIR